MAKLTPMTQDELAALAASCEDAVHDWRQQAERARKALGTLVPTMDQVMAIQLTALAMLDLAAALMVREQIAEMREATRAQVQREIAGGVG